MPRYVELQRGDPAPWFRQRTLANPQFVFDTTGGRYLVLCFLGSAVDPHASAAIAAAAENKTLFDDVHASFFGVTCDTRDEAERRIAESYPGYRYFLDFDLLVSRMYGAAPLAEPGQRNAPGERENAPLRRMWVVVGPTLRVIAVQPFREDRSDIKAVLDLVRTLPPPTRYAGTDLQAPILVLPDVFDREFCNDLIDLYKRNGGESSGFMRERDGKTVLVSDPNHKRRRDHIMSDEGMIQKAQTLFRRRVIPEIRKAHQFNVTRMERYLVACYEAADLGHFRAHRDNTTKGTAHRRFAASVNLNEDFDGGEVWFPEYGARGFKPAAGTAIVFSCSLLHAVRPVTRAQRYAFLPFLYDEAAAAVRAENLKFIAGRDQKPAGADETAS